MTYTFHCPECRALVELEQRMNADHTPPTCACGKQTQRIFNSRYNCDEIRSTRYFNPDVGAEVTDHGRKYDIGMGAWYTTKSQRKQLMKEKGLGEYGPEQKNPPSC